MNNELFLEEEVSGSQYARWIQRALNAVMGLRLAVDGIVGPQTRSAIRSFQRRSHLVEDGVVGPQTQAALLAAGAPPLSGGMAPSGGTPRGPACASLKPKEILDNFRRDSADIQPQHDLKINRIALCIRDSQKGASPVRRVEITGHASAEGDPDYNDRLGAARAERVRSRLRDALARVLPGLETRVELRTGTRGENEPTGRGAEPDRRVEIALPLKTALPPLPPRPKPRVDIIKVVIKSFIALIRTRVGAPTCSMILPVPVPPSMAPVPTTASMRLRALAEITDRSFHEDPTTDAMIKDYRLFSQAIFRVESAGGNIIRVTPSNLITDAGKECDPTRTLCLQPPPLTIVAPLTVRTGPTSFTFSWAVKGRPHKDAEIAFVGVCPRSSIFIWHRVTGIVDVSSGSPVVRIPKFEGSEFPSHRLFVNGVDRGNQPQGEFRQLWIPSPADATLVR